MSGDKSLKHKPPMIKEKNINVAIADDHPIVINGVKAILSNHDSFEFVGLAYSETELMQKLPILGVDVLLLDLNMHGKDIYKVISHLKGKFPKLKIIAYTSYESPGLVKSILNKGVHGYILKNTHKEEIYQAIFAVMNDQIYIGKSVKISKSPQGDNRKDIFFEDDFQKKLRLSIREQEILVLISKGYTSQTIGSELFISKHTVETHRKNILRKLNVNSSAELVKFAVLQGIV